MAWGQAGSPVYSILQNPFDVFLESDQDSEMLFRFASRPGKQFANIAQSDPGKLREAKEFDPERFLP
jgi:hypothetical protein